jgi:hypothetical protein
VPRKETAISKTIQNKKKFEDEIDDFFDGCFNTPAGKRVMLYLSNKTLLHVGKIGVPLEILADEQGQRRIVGEILMRAKRGKES